MRVAACTSFSIATSSEGMPIAATEIDRQTIPVRTASPEKFAVPEMELHAGLAANYALLR